MAFLLIDRLVNDLALIELDRLPLHLQRSIAPKTGRKGP